MHSAAFVLSGYLITGATLGGYVLLLYGRARRARQLAEAVAARRDDRS